MSTSLLNLGPAPKDPVERIMWLSGVTQRARQELDRALADALFKARLEHRFDEALAAMPGLSRKRALALTRSENERRGRPVRWNDGLDPSSTAYRA